MPHLVGWPFRRHHPVSAATEHCKGLHLWNVCHTQSRAVRGAMPPVGSALQTAPLQRVMSSSSLAGGRLLSAAAAAFPHAAKGSLEYMTAAPHERNAGWGQHGASWPRADSAPGWAGRRPSSSVGGARPLLLQHTCEEASAACSDVQRNTCCEKRGGSRCSRTGRALTMRRCRVCTSVLRHHCTWCLFDS
jgi:hypothetical protein